MRVYFPDLQLRRMAIPLSFIALVPAALWSSKLFCTRGPHSALLRAALLAFLLMGIRTNKLIYGNQGNERFTTLTAEMQDLINWIKAETPSDARILFAGHTVHKYGHAHVAALPLLTGREMMACDYYAFSPKEVEYDYPPREFRTIKPDGHFQFMDLYNVNHLITYHNNYKKYYDERPHHFEKIFSITNKHIDVYRVKRDSKPLLKGTGTVHGHFNSITIHLEGPEEEVVVRYNWDEQMVVNPPAELFPYQAHEQVTFIGIHPNGETNITLNFKSWL